MCGVGGWGDMNSRFCRPVLVLFRHCELVTISCTKCSYTNIFWEVIFLLAVVCLCLFFLFLETSGEAKFGRRLKSNASIDGLTSLVLWLWVGDFHTRCRYTYMCERHTQCICQTDACWLWQYYIYECWHERTFTNVALMFFVVQSVQWCVPICMVSLLVCYM